MISFGCHICDISVMSISWHKYLGSKFWYQFDINLTSRFVLVTYQWRVNVKVTLNWPKCDVTMLLGTPWVRKTAHSSSSSVLNMSNFLQLLCYFFLSLFYHIVLMDTTVQFSTRRRNKASVSFNAVIQLHYNMLHKTSLSTLHNKSGKTKFKEEGNRRFPGERIIKGNKEEGNNTTKRQQQSGSGCEFDVRLIMEDQSLLEWWKLARPLGERRDFFKFFTF